MSRPLETIDLGDKWLFEACGRELTATVTLKVWADDIPFDGDDPEDIAGFERGDFQMYVAEVSATFADVTGTDILGGIAASKLEDVTACMEENGMISNALSELADKVERIQSALGL